MRCNQCSAMIHGIQSYIKLWEINDYCIGNLITAIYSEAMFSLKTNSKHSRPTCIVFMFIMKNMEEGYGKRH